ncbi:hypothetical protein [Stenotrophomonas sp. NPDC077461]|uniref:hypothetical protein n=1 Tax=Stenotrophomonas sp. NPDC077461 TaxID=3414698 RepID=UPI003C2B9C1C
MDQLSHLLTTLGELAGLAVPEGLPSGTRQAVPPDKSVHGLVGDAQALGQGALGHPFVQQGLDFSRGAAAEEAFAWTHRSIAAKSP